MRQDSNTRSTPHAALLLVGMASFVAGTFFRLKPLGEDAFRTLNTEKKTVVVPTRIATVSDAGIAAAVPEPGAAASIPAAPSITATVDERCQSKLDSLDHTWDLRRDARRKATAGRTLPYVPPNVHWQSPAVFDFFEPEAVCMDDERFGSISEERYMSFGDGPKFVCGVDRIIEKAKANKDCLIYSVGSNNEIDFEVAVANIMGAGNCEVHTFDPTVHSDTFVGHHVAKFHEWGFGKDGLEKVINHRRGKFNFTEMSLVTAMKKLDHYGKRKIDIFKIDCEGCEFLAMREAFEAISRGEIQVDQVQIEIHGGNNPVGTFPLLKQMMEAADAAGMRVFHKEPNSWGCNGYACVEYAFVSKEFLRTANAHYVC